MPSVGIATRRTFGYYGEYVEGKWDNCKLKELTSFQLILPNHNEMVYGSKQNQEFLLTFDEYHLTAPVRFDELEQLDFDRAFEDIKLQIFERIVFTEIIKDKLLDDRTNAIEELKQHFIDRSGKTLGNLDYAEDLYQLSLILDKQKHPSNESILKAIIDNCISNELKVVCKRLLKNERYLNARSCVIPELKRTDDLCEELKKIHKNGLNSHRKGLYDEYLLMPSKGLKDHLDLGSESARYADDKLVLLFCRNDMKLFSELLEMMSEQPFLNLVKDSWDALFDEVKDITYGELTETFNAAETTTLRKYVPLTHPVYLYLCKSFMEVIQEIITKANISAIDWLIKRRRTFNVLRLNKINCISAAKINWYSPSPLNEVLERQYYFLFQLMEFFKPGSPSKKKKWKFTYKLKVLQRFVDKASRNTETRSDDGEREDDRWIWLYILDDALSGLLFEEQVQSFEPVLESFTDFVITTKVNHYESFRTFTHNTVRFITLMTPFISKETASEIDREILRKQLNNFKKAISEKQWNDLRVLVDVYNEYWKHNECVIKIFPMKFPHEPFKSNMQGISRELISIVDKMLSTNAKPEMLIHCFRSFNVFLQDLDGIDFNWFIKCEGNAHCLTEAQVVNESKRSYKVLDPKGFIQKKGTDDLPRHYLIEVIVDLLAVVNDSLCHEKWLNDSDDIKLKAMTELFSAMRKSFHYLQEQPDYVSFDEFKKDRTQPFISALENTNSFDIFKNSIHIVGESFSYLKKQNDIDVIKALKLYEQMNDSPNTEILGRCYDVYQRRFNFYVEETINRSQDDKIKFIVENVQKLAEPMSIGEYGDKLSKKTLPELLAGLAAVWSIQQSTVMASTGKSLKPHCIQILCILRLLSVDKGSVVNHLAQVLTGQGKSVILGLVSSLLALMGHKVHLVCYNKYLASRNEQDFKEFFQRFQISDKIIYGTFEEMAKEVLSPEVNGKKQHMEGLLSDRILKHSKEENRNINFGDVNNTILLIDEADVFFSEKFYGNTYNSVGRVKLPALASIQEKLWEVTKGNVSDKNTISHMIKGFIKSEVEQRNEDFEEFNKFLLKPEKYKLLKREGVNIYEKEYTNQSLYDEHIDRMIDCAMSVTNGSESDSFINKFKIKKDGIIACRKDDEVYSTNACYDYYNTFNYFRLKTKNFDHKSYVNYGYFIIFCGKVSYARLPEKYFRILGVSGTLTSLNADERKVLSESYSIKKISSMPSFFGLSKITFDLNNEFSCLDTKETWLRKIHTQTNRKINKGRSVLIFFHTSAEINEFKERFFREYDRLFVLTEDTEYWLKKKYIDEAGITKTVTLASRGMGRGVDFKSSLTVEKNGGVHVIQTFLSLDMKEETQIKGRTARKDNEGSYQLILCKQHLIKNNLLENFESVNYQELNERRNEKYREITLKNNERVKQAHREHEMTMKYVESFFKRM